MSADEDWSVYLALCNDGTLYCGISNGVEARVEKHNQGKGARYTAGRRPIFLVWCCMPMSKSEAASLEYKIKKLTRTQKWEIIKGETYEL
jgi:putative endonuclease